MGATELSRYHKLQRYLENMALTMAWTPPCWRPKAFRVTAHQSVRSPAGAIGVMQLLPSTAKDKNVAIPNIDELEPNIEAGAKYMAFLKERYFSGPELMS